jgi:hypothetical protein
MMYQGCLKERLSIDVAAVRGRTPATNIRCIDLSRSGDAPRAVAEPHSNPQGVEPSPAAMARRQEKYDITGLRKDAIVSRMSARAPVSATVSVSTNGISLLFSGVADLARWALQDKEKLAQE